MESVQSLLTFQHNVSQLFGHAGKFHVNFAPARVIWEEGPSTEKNSFISLDWKKDCGGIFLTKTDVWGASSLWGGPPWAGGPGSYKKAEWATETRPVSPMVSASDAASRSGLELLPVFHSWTPAVSRTQHFPPQDALDGHSSTAIRS